MVSSHAETFGGYMHCSSKGIKFVACKVILQLYW